MEKNRILVVDDEPSFTRLVKFNLEKSGIYDVRTENDGKRALETAREFQPDLVLLDVIMPSVDGGQVAADIQAEASLKDTPIVFLTAVVTRPETENGARNIAGRPFLAKPVTVGTLMHCIEEHLKK